MTFLANPEDPVMSGVQADTYDVRDNPRTETMAGPYCRVYSRLQVA